MDNDALVVGGFTFLSYKEAQAALKEQKNVEVIRERVKESDPKEVYELYCKLIERDMFKTMIGYSYLYELRNYLLSNYYIEQELPCVVLPRELEFDKVNEMNQNTLQNTLQKALDVKKRMSIAIVVLCMMIIGMFVIAVVNPNVGYINTENKVLNKYAAWQEDLEERERILQEKELELQKDLDN